MHSVDWIDGPNLGLNIFEEICCGVWLKLCYPLKELPPLVVNLLTASGCFLLPILSLVVWCSGNIPPPPPNTSGDLPDERQSNLPLHTVPCQYHFWGMLGRQAGSTVSVHARECNAESPKQGSKGSILKEDKILCLSGYIIYLWLRHLVYAEVGMATLT